MDAGWLYINYTPTYSTKHIVLRLGEINSIKLDIYNKKVVVNYNS